MSVQQRDMIMGAEVMMWHGAKEYGQPLEVGVDKEWIFPVELLKECRL